MAGGRKRQHVAVNPITNYFSREKRQDTKRSPNNENEVSFEHLKTQKQQKRGLGEKTNKKARQPLQEIGGASNVNLNTGLISRPEHREQWSVYSDEPTRSDADDKKDTQPPKQVPLSASQEPKEHDNHKESSQEKIKQESSQEQEPASPSGDEQSRTTPFQLTDDDASDEDPYKGFFDDDDDDDEDLIITKTRRPKRLEKRKVPTRQQEEEKKDDDTKQEDELVPQFSIPAPSPVFDEPLASFPPDDIEEHPASASFPALFTTSLPSDAFEDSPSVDKQDSKLRGDNDNDTSDKGDNSSSGRTVESLASTVPISADEQFEAHDALPVPRGKTLLEKLGVQSQKSE